MKVKFDINTNIRIFNLIENHFLSISLVCELIVKKKKINK